jgi:hypothetical protein
LRCTSQAAWCQWKRLPTTLLVVLLLVIYITYSPFIYFLSSVYNLVCFSPNGNSFERLEAMTKPVQSRSTLVKVRRYRRRIKINKSLFSLDYSTTHSLIAGKKGTRAREHARDHKILTRSREKSIDHRLKTIDHRPSTIDEKGKDKHNFYKKQETKDGRYDTYATSTLTSIRESRIAAMSTPQEETKTDGEAPKEAEGQEESVVVMANDNGAATEPEPEQRRATVNMPVEWTQLGVPAPTPPPKRLPHDVIDISVEEEEIVVVGTAGQKITVMGDDFSSKCNPQLKQLVLRSHQIKKMQGLDLFTSLELLELYDNMIDELSCLEGPSATLTTLDMSYNVIREMAPVAMCTNLTELCT